MESILSNEDILRRVSFAPAFMPIPTVEAITDLTNDTDRALRELGYMTIDRRILLLDRQRACYLLGSSAAWRNTATRFCSSKGTHCSRTYRFTWTVTKVPASYTLWRICRIRSFTHCAHRPE